MPARPPRIPRTKRAFVPTQGKGHDPETQRALNEAGQAIADNAPAFRVESDTVVADLKAGPNRIRHRLGRKPVGVQVTPTIADASFAWAVLLDGSDGNKQPNVEIWVDVVGVAQPGAAVRIF